MPLPWETARIVRTHAGLEMALHLLARILEEPELDPDTTTELAGARASIRSARDRMYHRAKRDLDTLEVHELEYESRPAVTT